ncbi:MAG: hypothetical protein B7X93_11640 [Hydrogenophilales bacterium 17-61-9]|jgi:hypothetical protein|nr:MAG: hypothetical protein B7X93_11640 [Hydrogenophilales bacterium 17-61-9]
MNPKTKNALVSIGLFVLTILCLLLTSSALRQVGPVTLKVMADNMTYMGAPCGIAYLLLHKVLFKGLVKNRYVHILLFPASAVVSAFFLFRFSLTRRSEGMSFFANEISSGPLYGASAAGVLATFLVVFVVTFFLRRRTVLSQ